ncbi:peroxide stress protein YaaA [Aegicerativicinus sediminis]|uniref:peroxide stress protein YaaA n=1 Tax=Aegicerativicinus sediminis TaxID=2893202 RepID=UPI001E601416|nr:peroxide stress protein YaaA [Aegicerativicinus sediminis]
MKLVLSPAKSLDYETKLPTDFSSEAQFLKEAKRINSVLKKKSIRSLGKLMDISKDLSGLNYERNQKWELPFTLKNARQAIYAFNGDVYRGFDAYTLDSEKYGSMQNKVRILSGLYGVLKPFDLIQPYRLEMGTDLRVGGKKNLYEFWKSKVTNALNKELEKDELFVNLASNEYFKAVDAKKLKGQLVNIKFQELKGDTYKTIAIFSKLARGAMARYIVDNNIEDLEGLKGFNVDNYSYNESMSKDNELVFVR